MRENLNRPNRDELIKKKTREIYACVFGLKVNHDDGFFMHANGEKKCLDSLHAENRQFYILKHFFFVGRFSSDLSNFFSCVFPRFFFVLFSFFQMIFFILSNVSIFFDFFRCVLSVSRSFVLCSTHILANRSHKCILKTNLEISS